MRLIELEWQSLIVQGGLFLAKCPVSNIIFLDSSHLRHYSNECDLVGKREFEARHNSEPRVEIVQPALTDKVIACVEKDDYSWLKNQTREVKKYQVKRKQDGKEHFSLIAFYVTILS